MKRKNASISNADILYNYVHNNCPRRFFIDFYGVSTILSTLFMLCGQIVDKLSSVDKFIIFSIFNNSLFYKGLRGYLPQQFLYFLPLPHVLSLSVYMVHIVYIVLLVFQAHENPCWTCQKACGGCSWSRSFSPVPGWRANKTKKRGQGGTKGGYIESYYIRSCPEYDPEPKRDIPEEKGGQRLKYDIDKVMLLTRAGMTEAQAGGRFMSRSAEDQV